jgi:hypothetical protein
MGVSLGLSPVKKKTQIAREFENKVLRKIFEENCIMRSSV